VPAAAVIPALGAYINAVVVKKLVADFLTGVLGFLEFLQGIPF